jgi:hypothetical protein
MVLALAACSEPTGASPAASAESSSATPPTSAAPPRASAAPTVSAGATDLDKTLAELFGAAVRVEVVGTESGKSARAATEDKQQIVALLAAIGDKQRANGPIAKCPTPTTITFFDEQTALGSVGSCASAGVIESSKSAARVDLPSGAMGGIQVADISALRVALEPLKIKLP